MGRSKRNEPVLPEEVLAVLGACERDPGPSGARDAALLCLFAGHGLRSAVVQALPVEAYDPRRNQLFSATADGTILLSAKLGDTAARMMNRWLSVRGSDPGPLFVSTTRSEVHPQEAIGGQAITQILLRRCRQAGVPPYAADDLVRTHSLLRCGCWTSRDCGEPHTPDTAPKAPLLGEHGSDWTTVLPGESWAEQRRYFARFLGRLSATERQFTLDALTAVLAALGQTGANAFLFDWPQLGATELRQVGGWLRMQDSNRRRRIWRALVRVLWATDTGGRGTRLQFREAIREALRKPPAGT